jgi:hypothetical protein
MGGVDDVAQAVGGVVLKIINKLWGNCETEYGVLLKPLKTELIGEYELLLFLTYIGELYA